MAAAVFNYGQWALLYPNLALCVSEPQAQAFFLQAGLYCDNSDCSPISDLAQRLMLMNLLVAHLAEINHRIAQGNGGLVGPIRQAQEGSVSVTVAIPDVRGLEFWFLQTPYGAQYWAATAGYRTAHYVAAPPYDFGPYGFGFGGGWGNSRWPN
jgi:hypothetical protein